MSTVVTPTPPVAPPLATPDPAMTTEAFVALCSTALPFVLVLFHYQMDGALKGGILAALGAIYGVFILWHGSKVRAARAIGRGLAAGNNTINVAKL